MNVSVLVLLIGCLLPVMGIAQPSGLLPGKWKDQANPEKQVEMYRQPDGKIGGKAISPANASGNERPVFKDLVWDNGAKAYRGVLIQPDTGGELMITVSMPRLNQFEFVVKRFFMSRTFRFIRIE